MAHEKLNNLHCEGLRVQDSAMGDINVKCLLFVVSTDLPAHADVMNMKIFMGDVDVIYAKRKASLTVIITFIECGLLKRECTCVLTIIS